MIDHSTPPKNDADNHCNDVAAFLRVLHQHGDVFEVRSIKCPDRAGGSYLSTSSGYFNDADKAAKAIEQLEKLKPPAIYVTINPVAAAMLARAANRIQSKADKTTSKLDVVRRQWLFIDIDSKRPSGISATDSELREADSVSIAIMSAMTANGWPEPLQGMSGNGRYLLWKIDLPNDDVSETLVKQVLQSLASRFDTDGAEVDTSTFDANRIGKVLGTIARKGDELVGVDGAVDRPHRQSWFVPPVGELQVVPKHLLQALADSVPAQSPKIETQSSKSSSVVRSSTIERASKYLAKMEAAVAGSKGHNALFAAACALVVGFDLHVEVAYSLLQNEYNPRCEPPWDDAELRHKVESAMKVTDERGKLLRENSGLMVHKDYQSNSLPVVAAADAPWPEPKALPDPLPSVMAYSSDLLPRSIGAAVDDIAERMQCPPDFPAAAMLVALAALVGRRVGIRPKKFDDWLVVPNLWGAVVGRPSLKKSPAIATAEARIRGIEAREYEKLSEDILSSGVDSLLAESRIKARKADIAKAMKQGDEIEARKIAEEVQKLSEEGPPVPRRIITSDTSIEKLCDMLNVHKDGMLLWVDELVGWMRSLDREDKGGVRQQFLTLWNGQGRLNIDRIGRGETVCDSPCVGVFGCCTPGGLSDYVSAAVRGGRGADGLIQRLQVTVWPDSPKEYRHVDRWPDGPSKKLLTKVFEDLADLDPSEFAQLGEFDDGGIRWLRFDAEGQAIFDRWYTDLQVRVKESDLPEAFEDHLSKFASMMPSIALVLHLVRGDRGPVTGAAASLAVRWANYLESHANRVYSIATAPERQAALPLLKRLLDWPADKPIRVRAIREHGWAHLSESESIESALDLLIECGWAREVDAKPSTGRPTTEFILHPQARIFLKGPRVATPETPETSPKLSFEGFEGSVPGGSENKSGRKRGTL